MSTTSSPQVDPDASPAVGVEPRPNRLAQSREYSQRAQDFRARGEALSIESRRISNLRGLSFGALVVSLITAAATENELPALVVAALSALSFGVLVVWHSRVIQREDRAFRHYHVNARALSRVRDDFARFEEDGSQYESADHPYSGDLDLFGPRSLFQCMNVAHTTYGQSALAAYLSTRDERERIVERQQAVRELSARLDERQTLEAYTLAHAAPPGEAKPRKAPPLDLGRLIAWAESEPVLSKQKALVLAARVLPALSLAGALGWHFASLPAACWALPLALQLVISMRAAAHAGEVFSAVSSSPGAFGRLRPTLELLESWPVEAPLMTRLKRSLSGGRLPASRQMVRFERVLAWFELRHNGMVYPFINALLLWDVHSVVALEKWQVESGRALRGWLEGMGQWEALSSLAGFAHDNADYAFPEIANGPSTFEAFGLGHPLIPPASRVGNDVVLSGPGTALLVTGSNMSGKSTLLRAMGMAAVLGMAGTAVCAKRMKLSPMCVYTSMRISDSLSAGVSHFYAELKKLRAVLEATSESAPVLFLLDEILHGTNSEERQVGARWILAELIRAGATGAVSTHDMGLCELPPELMDRVRTVHLRESVEGEEMTFDYRLRQGPVKGGNALLLMRSLGLEVPLSGQAAAEPG